MAVVARSVLRRRRLQPGLLLLVLVLLHLDFLLLLRIEQHRSLPRRSLDSVPDGRTTTSDARLGCRRQMRVACRLLLRLLGLDRGLVLGLVVRGGGIGRLPVRSLQLLPDMLRRVQEGV